MIDYQNNISSLALVFLNIFSKCQVWRSVIPVDFKKIINRITTFWEGKKSDLVTKKIWMLKAR